VVLTERYRPLPYKEKEVLSGILVLGPHHVPNFSCKIYQLAILGKFADDTKFGRTSDTKKERLQQAPTNLDEWGQKWAWSSVP
jgi:hypothetical protein